MKLKEKEIKDDNHRGNLLTKKPRESICRQRILKSRRARKETVHTISFISLYYILTKSRNGDRKIIQTTTVTSRPATREGGSGTNSTSADEHLQK